MINKQKINLGSRDLKQKLEIWREAENKEGHENEGLEGSLTCLAVCVARCLSLL